MLGPCCSSFKSRIVRLLLFTAGPLVLMISMGLAGLRFNATASVPTGLYWISSDPRAEFVEFCPPEPFGTLSVMRGYRSRSGGSCPDGGVPLLKPIVARSGDVVEISPRGMSVNHTPVPNTAPKSLDTASRLLVPWPYGRYEVGPDKTWVASSYNSRSFDSRYFGPITEDAIKHRLQPIWTE